MQDYRDELGFTDVLVTVVRIRYRGGPQAAPGAGATNPRSPRPASNNKAAAGKTRVRQKVKEHRRQRTSELASLGASMCIPNAFRAVGCCGLMSSGDPYLHASFRRAREVCHWGRTSEVK